MKSNESTQSPTHKKREVGLECPRCGCRHLPVLAGSRVITMLSMRDLLQDDLEEQLEENQQLRAYLHQVPATDA